MRQKLFILWLMLLAGASGLRAAEAYTYFDPSDGSLNFCYDNYKSNRGNQGFTTYDLNTGNNTPAWSGIASQVKELYFFNSFANYRPTSCYKWAYMMVNLLKITNIYNLVTTNVTNMSYMFTRCDNLNSGLDVSGFNTSNVTDMSWMFSSCHKITSLNVSKFSTAKVTRMDHMFYNCDGLTQLNLSNFNTSNVTTMSEMFAGCSNLTSLNVSSFNTSKVTTMSYMFSYCSKLTTLNVSNFTTSSITTSLEGMFKGCSKVTSLTLNFWISSSTAQKSNQMLYGCSALKSLTLKDTGYASDAFYGVGTASSPCTLSYSTTSHPTFSTITPNYVVLNQGYFKNQNMRAFVTLNSSGELQFRYSDWYWSYNNDSNYKTYVLNTGSNNPGWYGDRTSVKNVVFDPSFANARPTSCRNWFAEMENLESITGMENLKTNEVTTMEGMFKNCSKLTNLYAGNFNTANVTDMTSMFYGCNSLVNLNVGGFQTNKLKYAEAMFYGCKKLTALNVSGFNIDNLSDASYMFYGCESLTALDVSRWNLTDKDYIVFMFGGCKKLESLDLSSCNFALVSDYNTGILLNCTGLKTLKVSASANNLYGNACNGVGTQSAPCTLIYPDGFTPEKTAEGNGWYQWKNGFFKDDAPEPYALLSTDKKTLTFYYDKKRDTRTETTFDLNEGDEEPGWRNNVSSIESVVFDSSFANARPTSCYMWFKGMTNLTSIMGISNLKTEEVTNMRYMFLDCHELKNVDVSGFNTSKVTDMGGMFYYCRSLESIDVSGFDTGNVTNMGCMFINCYYLESIDLSGFNTEKVTNMGGMFSSCIRLKNLDVSGFNTSNVTSMATMFTNCPVLESLDVSGFNTENVTDMTSMFAYCRSLQSLDVSGFDTEKVEEMESMFAGCTGLTSLDVSNFTFKSNTNTYSFLYGCSNLQKLVIPATASYWNNRSSYYEGACKGVGTQSAPCTLIYPSGFTPEKTSEGDGWYMWKDGYFKDAEPEPYAVLSTDKKTLTFYYDNHKGLLTGTTYDLNTGSERPGWFDYNSPVTNVVFDSSFADARPTSCKSWFYQMTNLTSITGIEYLNTSNVTNMASMFAVCKRLSNIDVSHFNTAQVKDMSAMFEQCSFTSIDVSNFDTSNVTNMVGMFYNNKSLETLDISNFVIPDSTNFYGNGTQLVFVDCQNLKTLILPSTAYNFKYGTCTRVGTQSAPCTLIYPADFTPEKTSEGDGWYMWKGGYFKDKVQFPLGDVNHDGYITVVDASLTVDYVMGNNPPVFFIENADMNSDGSVSITDVSKIVDIVLNGSASHAPATAREATMDRLWLTANGGHCLLHLDTPERYTAMHITLRLPDGASMGNIRLSSSRSASHSIGSRAIGDGLYNIVLYANNNSELRSDDTALLHFDIAGCQPRDVEVVVVQSTNRLFETIMSSGITTGIDIVETDDATDGDSYNTVGVRVGKNARGVVIKNGSKKIEN